MTNVFITFCRLFFEIIKYNYMNFIFAETIQISFNLLSVSSDISVGEKITVSEMNLLLFIKSLFQARRQRGLKIWDFPFIMELSGGLVYFKVIEREDHFRGISQHYNDAGSRAELFYFQGRHFGIKI